MDNSLKLTAIPKDLLINLLTQAGSRLATEEALNQLIASGLPTNNDGTINLVELAAFLLKGDS
jgi:hypothetical protein